MAKLSQKELLDEGFASLAKGAAKLAGGALGGAVGAVGNTLKYGAQHGVDSTLGGTLGAAGGGAMKGAKIGSSPIKSAKKAIKNAWERAGGGGSNRSLNRVETELEAYLEKLGYMLDPSSKFGIMGQKEKTAELVELNYDTNGMVVKPGRPIRVSARTFKSAGGGQWKEIPQSGVPVLKPRVPAHQPANNPDPASGTTQVNASFSQKNLLRRLHMLRG